MKPKMFSVSAILACMLTSCGAFANSYVGNGGSQGDVELLVTLTQIKETFQVIEEKGKTQKNLCQCNEVFEGRSVCEPLKALDEQQSDFCNKALNTQASQILKLIDHRDEINIRWTNSPIEVEESGKLRAADAVASRARKEIVIRQQTFLEMKQPERVLLLTHELFHFTELNGQALTDTGPVGPFKGEQGSRHLIDAMSAAASVSIGVFPEDIQIYRSQLIRSQAWKSNWITLDFGSASVQGDQNNTFAGQSYSRTQISYRRQWDHWGLMGAWRSETDDKTVMDTISTTETVSILSAGVSYRVFFFSDPLTFTGQSNMVIHALAENIQAKYKLSDNYTGANDSASAFGSNFGAAYYLPLYWGFWLDLGLDYETHPYKYNSPLVNLNMNHNLLSGYIGASCAF